MKISEELLRKAAELGSAEELIAAAKASGIDLTAEDAAQYFAKLHQEGELAEEELSNVTGGCGSNVPDGVSIDSANPVCPSCGASLFFKTNTKGDGMVRVYLSDDDGNYDIYACSSCGKTYRHHWEGDRWTKN